VSILLCGNDSDYVSLGDSWGHLLHWKEWECAVGGGSIKIVSEIPIAVFFIYLFLKSTSSFCSPKSWGPTAQLLWHHAPWDWPRPLDSRLPSNQKRAGEIGSSLDFCLVPSSNLSNASSKKRHFTDPDHPCIWDDPSLVSKHVFGSETLWDRLNPSYCGLV